MRPPSISVLALVLFASMSFAWQPGEPPSCLSATQYNVLGYNFLITTNNSLIPCNTVPTYGVANYTAFPTGTSFSFYAHNGGTGSGSLLINFTGMANTSTFSASSSGTAITGWCCGGSSVSSSISNGTDSISYSVAPGSWATTISISWNANKSKWQISDGTTTIYATENATITVTSSGTAGGGGGGPSEGQVWGAFSVNTAGLNYLPGYNYGFEPSNLTWAGTYAGFSGTGGSTLLRSDYANGSAFGSPSSYSKAILYYGGNLIIPLISYAPGVSAFAHFYNVADNVAYIKNNTATYVLDSSTQQWYLVPPYTFADTTTIYTLGTFLYPYSNYSSSQLPMMPFHQSCTTNGSLYQMSTDFSTPVTHVVAYGDNTTLLYYTQYSSTFNYSVNTQLYPNVNYTANGNVFCQTSSGQSSLLPITQLVNIPNVFRPMLYIVFAIMLAVSTIIPFALIVPIALNDAFALTNALNMALTVVVVGAISLVAQPRYGYTLKTLAVYGAFLFAIFTTYFFNANLPILNTALTTSFNQLVAATANVQPQSFVAAVPTFIVSLMTFFLAAPLTLVDTLMSVILMISPPIYSVLGIFATAAKVGIYVWIGMMGYQVLAKLFPGVL